MICVKYYDDHFVTSSDFMIFLIIHNILALTLLLNDLAENKLTMSDVIQINAIEVASLSIEVATIDAFFKFIESDVVNVSNLLIFIQVVTKFLSSKSFNID